MREVGCGAAVVPPLVGQGRAGLAGDGESGHETRIEAGGTGYRVYFVHFTTCSDDRLVNESVYQLLFISRHSTHIFGNFGDSLVRKVYIILDQGLKVARAGSQPPTAGQEIGVEAFEDVRFR